MAKPELNTPTDSALLSVSSAANSHWNCDTALSRIETIFPKADD